MSAWRSEDRASREDTFAKGSDRVTETANDMKAHASTYDGFINLIKWSMPPILLIVAVVVLLIA